MVTRGDADCVRAPYDVWVVDPSTSKDRLVARFAELRAWSPDGRTVLVHELRPDLRKTGLYEVPLDGVGKRRFVARGFWVDACYLVEE
jgi:hypothetical protein